MRGDAAGASFSLEFPTKIPPTNGSRAAFSSSDVLAGSRSFTFVALQCSSIRCHSAPPSLDHVRLATLRIAFGSTFVLRRLIPPTATVVAFVHCSLLFYATAAVWRWVVTWPAAALQSFASRASVSAPLVCGAVCARSFVAGCVLSVSSAADRQVLLSSRAAVLGRVAVASIDGGASTAHGPMSLFSRPLSRPSFPSLSLCPSLCLVPPPPPPLSLARVQRPSTSSAAACRLSRSRRIVTLHHHCYLVLLLTPPPSLPSDSLGTQQTPLRPLCHTLRVPRRRRRLRAAPPPTASPCRLFLHRCHL